MEKIKVLIPTDFSVQAEFAYLMVRNLQQKIDMEIHFLHVLDVPDTVTLNAIGQIETCGDIDAGFVATKKDIAERNLDNLKKQYGEHIHTKVVLGKTTENILTYSTTNKFDLIVMGTKGAWGLKDKLSGSETQMIGRQSKIPLLSLMCDRSELMIANILLVHDFSKPQTEDLKLMHILLSGFQPKMHLLQIVNDETQKIRLLSKMDEFAGINGIHNYEKHLLNDKDVESGVIHFNQMHDMDMICIGTHGRKGVDRLIHPSATEKLINHLFKPILSFQLTNS